MVSNLILGALAALSLALLLWQWGVARRFPLHERVTAHSFPPAEFEALYRAAVKGRRKYLSQLVDTAKDVAA